MYQFFNICKWIVAIIVLLLSVPVFILYGVSDLISRCCTSVINGLADNFLSNFLIKMAEKYSEKQQKSTEND